MALGRVLFIDGTGGFDPHRIEKRPTGGIITSLTLIPRYLAKHGLQVTVASEYEGPRLEGVEYVREIREQDKTADVVVFNRNIYNHAFLDMFPRSKKIWWLHDIVDPRYMQDDSYTRMDKIVALSDYNWQSYSDFYAIQRYKFTKISNGVDKAVFYPGKPSERDRNLFVCASSTVKGMYPLAYTWNNLRRLNPKAELRMYSSQKLHDLKDGKAETKQLKELAKLGATICDPIPQQDLADVLRRARALLMPNHYPENDSNVLKQALACGTPVVATAIGSAREFVLNNTTGLLTHTFPHDMFWWHKDFALLTARIATDDALFAKLSAQAPKAVPSWDDIGSQWLKFLGRG